MKIEYLTNTCLTAALLVAAPSHTHGDPLLADGSFESLPVGAAPDAKKPAGAWYWPDYYLAAEGKDFSESFPSQLRIALAPGDDAGHALHASYAASDPGPGTVLPNVWSRQVTKDSGHTLYVSFDLFVTPGRGGGDVFFSNGRLLEGQFGPYLHWRGDVAKLYFLKPEGYLALFDYSPGVWQSVQVRIDMAQSRFDLEWRERGQSASIVRTGIPFTGSPPFIDRVEIARNAGESVDAYYDNFRVTTDPVIAPVSLELSAGSTGALKLANFKEGSAIQWKRNGADIAGANTPTLEIGAATAELAGEYTAVVILDGRSLSTEPATVRVHEDLAITSHPHRVEVPGGATSGFGVTATGSLPIRYQWQFNGRDLAGATNRFLSVKNAGTASEGEYAVVVSDARGSSVVSRAAGLAILVKPSFAQAPSSQRVVAGGNVTLSAQITGNPAPFRYQWRKGDSFDNSTVVSESLSSEKAVFLALTNVQPADAGTYRLCIANAAAPDISSTSPNRSFLLTVLPDTDGDGLPDEWENAHGLDPTSPADAPLDGDGDGQAALAEYRAGTAPTNGLSALRVESMAFSGGHAAVSFNAVANHTYTVECSPDVAGGSWERVADLVAQSNDRTATVMDPRVGDAARFYRVITPRRP